MGNLNTASGGVLNPGFAIKNIALSSSPVGSIIKNTYEHLFRRHYIMSGNNEEDDYYDDDDDEDFYEDDNDEDRDMDYEEDDEEEYL